MQHCFTDKSSIFQVLSITAKLMNCLPFKTRLSYFPIFGDNNKLCYLLNHALVAAMKNIGFAYLIESRQVEAR